MSDDPVVQKALTHRSYVLKELVDSEKEYVYRLRIAAEDYLQHIRAGGPEVPPALKSDILPIFSTLSEIYEFHRDVFLPELELHRDDAQALMKCFLDHKSDFAMYQAYCKNKPTSDSARSEYEDYFQSRQDSLKQKLNIDDVLIAPVQRLPKYQLLIRDLLKDTKKAGLETADVELALDLMMEIPKETNNIICLSLLRGISRAKIIGHGTLWRQDQLQFWDQKGARPEARQVFLFDHQIIVALTADHDGFFDYQMGIKTLNGEVGEADPHDNVKFCFTGADQEKFYFQAPTPGSKLQWLEDIRSILDTQSRMMRALIYGSAASPKPHVRVASESITWSDSDSSVDSFHSDHEADVFADDWPKNPGFHSLRGTPKKSSKKKKEKEKEKEREKRPRSHTVIPQSSTCPSIVEMENGLHRHRLSRRETLTASLHPRRLSRLFSRRKSQRNDVTTVRYPYPNGSSGLVESVRSPGAMPRCEGSPRSSSPADPTEILFIGKEEQPQVAEKLYAVAPGQVVKPIDTRQDDVWACQVMSGVNAGERVSIQRNCIEEYEAPMSYHSLFEAYRTKRDIGSGRFSVVRLAKQKATKTSHALKVLKPGTTEQQFHRELCIGSRVQHKNLLRYLGGIESKDFIITMECLVGHPLLEYLVGKASVTEATVCHISSQLLDALEYLHSHTILHLDVRPQNVFMHEMTREGDVVKLIDYGAARHITLATSPLNMDHESSFDYQYCPPEFFQHEPFGPGTDLWGFAVILFILFYGVSPFKSGTGSSIQTIANVTSVSYFFPDEESCSAEAREVIRSVLVARMSERPESAALKKLTWFQKSECNAKKFINLARIRSYMSEQ